MKQVSIIGHFAFGKNELNGQTIKTRIITDELKNTYGANNLVNIDTHGGFYNVFLSPFQVLKALFKSKNTIILPANNGLKVYAPLLLFFKHFFSGRKLHYVVIGGWLPNFLKNRILLTHILKKFDYIYVETNTMKKKMLELGFSNIVILNNCKNFITLNDYDLKKTYNIPYKLCTFSRVMPEKGIEDAINAVIYINNELKREVFSLDIYGQIDANSEKWFNKLQQNFPSYVSYCGTIPYDKTTEVIKNYYVMLFPTRFYTEGIPGSIIDAYSAGVPVIASKWESFSDILIDYVTGLGYKFNDIQDLFDKLFYVYNNPSNIITMKTNCLKKSKEYTPEYALDKLKERLK